MPKRAVLSTGSPKRGAVVTPSSASSRVPGRQRLRVEEFGFGRWSRGSIREAPSPRSGRDAGNLPCPGRECARVSRTPDSNRSEAFAKESARAPFSSRARPLRRGAPQGPAVPIRTTHSKSRASLAGRADGVGPAGLRLVLRFRDEPVAEAPSSPHGWEATWARRPFRHAAGPHRFPVPIIDRPQSCGLGDRKAALLRELPRLRRLHNNRRRSRGNFELQPSRARRCTRSGT